jgi:hypothetical protein
MSRRTDPRPARTGAPKDAQRRSVLLRDLGRAPHERAIFSLPSPLLPWVALFLGLVVAFFVQALVREGPAGALLAAAIVLGFLVVVLFPRKLIVGEDGLLLVWVRPRFIPYREIAYVETSDGFYLQNPGINIALRSGRAVDFATSVFKERWAERDALITLIRDAKDEAAGRKAARAPDALLRGGREFLAWAHVLRGIGSGANVDARTPPVPSDDLLRVAESSGAPLVERVAAFVALAASTDGDAKGRLRIAVDSTADPGVKAALQGAIDAGGDEHALARVLAYAEEKSGGR